MSKKFRIIIGCIIGVSLVTVLVCAFVVLSDRSGGGEQTSAPDTGKPAAEVTEVPEDGADAGLQAPFGNVVYKNGKTYYWKYSGGSFSSEPATFGAYQFDPDAANSLVCLGENGEESVILTDNGAEKICIAGDRIFYQISGSEYNSFVSGSCSFIIRSCSLSGGDVKDHGEGALLGLVEDGRYLIIREGGGEPYTVSSIDTSTLEKTVISQDRFLICDGDLVVCWRSENSGGSGFEEEDTVYTLRGDGSGKKDLHTELASTLPSVVYEMEIVDYLDGYVTISAPFVINGQLFYVYEHIAGSGAVTQSARIMKVGLDSGEAVQIPGEVGKEVGVFGLFDIDSDDEDALAYEGYVSDLEHLNALDKADYADFSGAAISAFGDESELLKVEYCEKAGDKEYVFMTYGKNAGPSGWRMRFEFVRAGLFVKDLLDGTVSEVYRTDGTP